MLASKLAGAREDLSFDTLKTVLPKSSEQDHLVVDYLSRSHSEVRGQPGYA